MMTKFTFVKHSAFVLALLCVGFLFCGMAQAEAWTSFTLWFAYMEDGRVVSRQLRNDVIGHTWKPYYYKDGKVYEYKAKKISSARFKRYENGKKMLRKYRKYGKVKSIFYRENGLVHVNYKSGGVRMNVTFRVSGNRLKKPVVDEGIYQRRITKQK